MKLTVRSSLLTWVFILATLVPLWLLVNAMEPSEMSAIEVRLILVGLALMMLVGVSLGLWIRPCSAYAGLVVMGSPAVTVVVWFVAFVTWGMVFQQATAATIFRSVFMLCLVVPIFAIPTAGMVRATHWLRDRQS